MLNLQRGDLSSEAVMNGMLAVLEKLFGPCPPERQAELVRALQGLIAAGPAGAPGAAGAPAPAARIPFLKTVSGLVNTAGMNEILPPIGRRYQVMAYAFSMNSVTATLVRVLSRGARDEELWRMVFQAPSNVSCEANPSTSYPSALFSTDSDAALSIELDASVSVHYSLTYWESD